MTLFILRHEERDENNPLFDSPLTDNGFEKSKKLVSLLQRLNIDIIYCSPFLRVIQTIYQYCLQTNKHVNVDNALYESLDSPLFTDNNKDKTWNNLPIQYKCIVNKDYNPVYDKIKLKESFEEIKERVSLLINKLDKSKNILIVSHKTTCNAIRSLFDDNINSESLLNMGDIIEINL